MLNHNCKDKDVLALIKYIADEDKDKKVLENQKLLIIPIVRNEKESTVGYKLEVWKYNYLFVYMLNFIFVICFETNYS